ncbi:uncharacterized protein LOC130802618 [Amaranthus tricolor]|uniref:uncharacterized protein LOC130802618 n=1 Tax=Amaranthus tricolor TaxID=29722 RepID=UPI00258D9870|nr:uncharacterized protein LOC130802618 [Amaranthus tricolor]
MPLSLWKRINAEIKPTRMSLQLADRSVRIPVGVVKDLPVQKGKFYVPFDFVIMDIIEDHVIPIILGRDFLKTTRVVFNVFNERVEDGRFSEVASLRKLLDEPDFYMEPVKETFLQASMTVKEERSMPP